MCALMTSDCLTHQVIAFDEPERMCVFYTYLMSSDDL